MTARWGIHARFNRTNKLIILYQKRGKYSMDLINELIIFSCISFLISLLGVIIYKGNVELIAEYDPKKVVDKNGLAKWVGSHFILMGI